MTPYFNGIYIGNDTRSIQRYRLAISYQEDYKLVNIT